MQGEGCARCVVSRGYDYCGRTMEANQGPAGCSAPGRSARVRDSPSTRPRRAICTAACRCVWQACAAVRSVCVSRLHAGAALTGAVAIAVWLSA